MSKKIGIVLAGCGVYDGAEVHESVISMLVLQKKGYELVFFAPDVEQAHVINHQEGVPAEGEKRRVLIESARVARTKVNKVSEARVDELDGLFFPGGFGVAKNLCTFAFEGEKMSVNKDVANLITAFHKARKPMTFLCIAPVLPAKVIGNGVELTIGTDPEVGGKIDAMGAKHIRKAVNEAHVDKANRIVTSPAYMSAANLLDVEASVNAAVKAFAELLG
ncbi:MAG: isoprenoid biosynthesis glyoxalase ElbB [Candidatus Sumerlaeia bacterium]|nr:isoprenoid biosynthesis glyoxalase ElbB [Candidatus Sumerlaeia bacterium]